MDLQPQTIPTLELLAAPGTVPVFATVLQAGVNIAAPSEENLASFLGRLPGFTREYIIDDIQTIFLNGTAVDDLQTPLTGGNPVLALSAAMPGLAGAIFRKNSFHAALRTAVTEKQTADRDQENVIVTLKLFNSIARDRGPALLAGGVRIGAGSLLSFFMTRPILLTYLRRITIDGRVCGPEELTGYLEEDRDLDLVVREVGHA